MATKLDTRQSVNRAVLGMIGNAANEALNTILSKIDAEMAKLFEDRNVTLSDGGSITFTGTQVQFTENLNLTLNQKISGAAPQVISLGLATQTLANGDMFYAVINRAAGTAVVAVASTLPAATSANQEVFLIAKRIDAGDGTARVYFRQGSAFNAGQTARLGSSGSGSGSGTGDDINTLTYRASFTDEFSESATAALSAVNSSRTTGVYNAAKGLYRVSYDASKTLTGTGTAMTISASSAYTVAPGDVIGYNGEVRRITAVTNQSTFTINAAFTVNPSASACVVSQSVHSKDIYTTAFGGNALSAAFTTTFSDIMVDYEDSSTVDDDIFDVSTAPVVAYAASGDDSAWTKSFVRPTLEMTQVTSIQLPAAASSLYLVFWANKTSGTGAVNVLKYKVYLQKDVTQTSGGTFNSAIAMLNGTGTPVNCTTATVSSKTQVTLTFPYALGVNTGAPYGSLDVYINGSLVPRFVNSTLTPDAAYTEISSTVIQLDRDYSSYAVSIVVLQRVSVIDTTPTSTLNLSALNANNDNNIIINPEGVINQRQASGTAIAIGSYGPDCWRLQGSAGTITTAQERSVLPGTMHNQRITKSGASGFMGAAQFIESADGIGNAGNTLNFSASIAGDGIITQARIVLLSWSGTQDNLVSGNMVSSWAATPTYIAGWTEVASATLTLSTGWQNVNCSGVIPSNAQNLAAFIHTTSSSGIGTYIRITACKLAVGSTATPYVKRRYGSELQLCQRFYTSGIIDHASNGNTGVGNTVPMNFFKVSMRVAPTISIGAPTGSTNYTSTSVQTSTTEMWSASIVIPASGFYRVLGMPWTAEAGL